MVCAIYALYPLQIYSKKSRAPVPVKGEPERVIIHIQMNFGVTEICYYYIQFGVTIKISYIYLIR